MTENYLLVYEEKHAHFVLFYMTLVSEVIACVKPQAEITLAKEFFSFGSSNDAFSDLYTKIQNFQTTKM